MSWTVIVKMSVEHLRCAAKAWLPFSSHQLHADTVKSSNASPRRQSNKSAQPGGRASVDGRRPGPASSAARKGTVSRSKRRRTAIGVSARRVKKPESDVPHLTIRRPSRPGSHLPESRIVAPPETQGISTNDKKSWATKDDDSLRRNIRWQWHRTAQRLVTYIDPSALALVVLVLTKELGLAPQTAVKLTLACLARATAGHFTREFLTTLSGKRRSRHHRSEDDVSRNGDDGSF